MKDEAMSDANWLFVHDEIGGNQTQNINNLLQRDNS